MSEASIVPCIITSDVVFIRIIDDAPLLSGGDLAFANTSLGRTGGCSSLVSVRIRNGSNPWMTWISFGFQAYFGARSDLTN
jgi:hypothetical protein